MPLRAIATLANPLRDPATDQPYYMVGGQFDGDDDYVHAVTPYGLLVFPRSEIRATLFVADELTVTPEDYPAVWFVNDINALSAE